ncbi:glutamic acid-rich protein-like [Helianthus annuus]|uniref:glutamic acid-rich protein-like n=1 Tax=Helianthus annuus TaxID=4232 RepID=UPI000B8F7E3F|nr:glutamic acid-rich protein-like [Helianthus annuus]
MLRDENNEDDVISATSDRDNVEKSIAEIAQDIENEAFQGGSDGEADGEKTESEELNVFNIKNYSVLNDLRARAEKRATRKKKPPKDSDDEPYEPDLDESVPVKKATKRQKKKARKVTEEPVIKTTSTGAEPVVTEQSAPIVEVENVIPILTPTTSQQTPTTPIQPISPQPQPQSQTRQQSQQTGPSSTTANRDRDYIFDDQPFPNFENIDNDFFNDEKKRFLRSEIKHIEAVIESLVMENERLLKVTKDSKEDRKLKDKKLEMLYKVLEKRLGINVEAEFNKIEIEEAEIRNAERARKAASEPGIINKETEQIDITKFILLSSVQVPELELEKEKEDDEKEYDEELDIEGSDHGDDDDKGDDDDNNQGGIELVVYEPRTSKSDAQNDYMNDNHNEEEVEGEGVHDDTLHDEETSGIFTDIVLEI